MLVCIVVLAVNDSVLECQLYELVVYFEALLDFTIIKVRIRLMVYFDRWNQMRLRQLRLYGRLETVEVAYQ